MAENKNNSGKTPKFKQPPTRDIDFQVDTIPSYRGVNGWFTLKRNSVTISYKDGQTKMDSLPHEQKHRDNYNQGLYEYPVSPEMAYKLDMHDEISANMAALIYLRQKYLETGDISVFDYNDDDPRYQFYKEAIEKGEIKPGSPYQEDFDKDMHLIANGTQKMWMDTYAEDYIEQNSSNGVYYGDTSGKYAQYYDQNYERGRKIALTIGGIDFTKYMNKDVEIPERGKETVKQKNVLYTDEKDFKLSNADFCKKHNLPAYDGSMSIEQYQKLLQHSLFCKNFNIKPFDSEIVADVNVFRKLGEKCDLPECTQKSVQESLQFVRENLYLITAAVQTAAQDYANKGKKLPESNNKAYKEAVDKLYTIKRAGKYNDKQFDGFVNVQHDLMPENKLPLTTLTSYTHNTIKENENFWNRAKSKISYWFNETKTKVSDLFSSGKTEKVKNEPINPVDKNKKPEYRKWENKDGSRVSEIQHRQLPDMTKDIIQKPTKSYTTEQKTPSDDKEKMAAIINYMNKINGSNKSIDVEKTVADLQQTYGDKALTLLQMAVNEPSNYAKYVGDASLKTSRAAVKHLCNIPEPQKVAEAIIQRKVSPNYKPDIKQQMKHESDKSQTKAASAPTNNNSLKAKLKMDFQKYSTMMKNLVVRNDAIPSYRKEIVLPVSKSEKDIKKTLSPNILKQRNDYVN